MAAVLWNPIDEADAGAGMVDPTGPERAPARTATSPSHQGRRALRVFVAGGSGTLGRRLLPILVERGHAVTSSTRTAAKKTALRDLGADVAVVDALDAEALRDAVVEAAPDVVVHEMTDLAGFGNLRAFERAFETTNVLRTRGTDNLLAAARGAGAKRFVAQSFCGWTYERTGGPVKTEADPLDPDPFPAQRTTLEAVRYLERAVTEADGLEGLALRYGAFYGPGTSLGVGGEHLEEVRRRRFPLVGKAGGYWSFIHIHDAAMATAAAIEHGAPGIYNVVDDDPAPVSQWLPELAKAADAKPPRHVPRWVARLAAGPHGVAMLTEVRGASNAKAKRDLDWTPHFPSWRRGFRHGLGEPTHPDKGES